MYFYIVTKNGYEPHLWLGLNITIERWSHILRLHANSAGYTHFKKDTSLIGGYWVNASGDAMVASPVEMDKDGNVV